MKHLVSILVFLIFYSSCIPLRTAPEIKSDKIMVAKKFKRKLPKNHAFIFEDPNNTNDFYNFINLKYELNQENVEKNIPFEINNEKYFLSYYETSIPTKTLDLFSMVTDAAVDMGLNKEDSYSGGVQIERVDSWYLVLTVCNSILEDCLEPNYKFRTDVIIYLRNLRLEYLDKPEK